jgi:hypothetical protein
VAQVKRLKDLELENSRLRKAVSDLTLAPRERRRSAYVLCIPYGVRRG